MAVGESDTIAVGRDGDLDLPVGSVDRDGEVVTGAGRLWTS